MLRIKSAQDFGAGLMFLLVGAGALWFGWGYEVGTGAQMGPGWFPRALGYGLLVFGLIFVLRGVAAGGPPIEASKWRPPLAILVAITAFALLIERAGLVGAVVACVLVSSLAIARADWRETLALAALLAVFCVVVFIYALNQSMSVFGG